MPDNNDARTRHSAWLGLAATLLAACSLGPQYQKPAVEVPPSWELGSGEAAAIVNPRWWEGFADPALSDLVAAALQHNRDLQVAMASLDEYRALVGVARSDLFPQLAAGMGASRTKGLQAGDPPMPDNPYSSEYSATLNLSYELDLWGRIARAEEAARADLAARAEARRALMLSVAGQVATSSIELAGLDKRLAIARAALASREEAYRLARIRFEGGITSELDLHQSAVELASARTLIPQLEQSIALTEHQLSVLVGHNPARIARGVAFDELRTPELPSLLPSELLRRRPDILQAEQELVAANARIGQAMAAAFPQFSLTGMIGEVTNDFLVFDWPTTLIKGGASVAAPLFTGWRDSRRIEAAAAREQQARFRYEKVVMVAFKEVYDALVSYRRALEQVAAQERQLAVLQETFRIARLRYLNGYTSFIDVLDAQRSLLNVELTLVQTKASVHQAMVALYMALGGGWEVEAAGAAGDAP
ncbi:MAG: efflux transporter outer membrane subunit [Thermodesulfobacteriota bacterium]